MEIELERTFLLKHKPENLENSLFCEITDIYFPLEERHPALRLRNRDGKNFTGKQKERAREMQAKCRHPQRFALNIFQSSFTIFWSQSCDQLSHPVGDRTRNNVQPCIL